METTTELRSTDRSRGLTGAARGVVPTLELAAIAGLAATIAIHVTELAGKVDEVTYLGFGYVALSAAAVVAIVMLAVGDRRGWPLAAATTGSTLVGYVLTRTTGLPGSMDDIGNWSEPLAIWAMVAEVVVCALAVAAFRRDRRPS
jgi:hypothetical protein